MKGGDLAFKVIVFGIAATIALGVIQLRRVKIGGELGGHFGLKLLSSLLLVLCWVFFVVLAVWRTRSGVTDLGEQLWMIQRCLFFAENIVIAFGLVFVMLTKFADRAEEAIEVAEKDVGRLSSAVLKHGIGTSDGKLTFGVVVTAIRFAKRLKSAQQRAASHPRGATDMAPVLLAAPMDCETDNAQSQKRHV